jgi:alpha-L-rhamnosidase
MKKGNTPVALVLTFLAVLAGGSSRAADAPLTPVSLRCEYQVDPGGIDETAPRLSWQVTSPQRDERQTAWEVLVADSDTALAQGKGNLWDSGKVGGDDTTAIVYGGRALVSGEVCHWKVRVWDRDGKVSDWSGPAVWSMGLLDQNDWRGQWIGYDKMRQAPTITAPFVGAKWIWFGKDTLPDFPKGKREFMSELKIPANVRVASAELLVATDGRVDFELNGQGVQMSHSSSKGKARLVDVGSLIHPGTNMVRVEIENTRDGSAGLIAQLSVTTSRGHTYTLVTDERWRRRTRAAMIGRVAPSARQNGLPAR